MNDTASERKFLLPWLSSAAVITAIRLLHATDLNYDTTLQIQAGQNLLAGNGLAIYWPASDDLAAPPALQVLTHFSAGYSLYAAALMAIGVPLSALVKISGAVATMIGWWGWARLAFPYMSGGDRRGRFWRFAGYWIAVASPLLFTSRWGGTDIVLWAAIPWILRFVTRAPALREQADLKMDALAGVLLGLGVLARYASMFLVPYVVLVIVGQCRLRPPLAAKRLAALGAGLFPALAIQVYISYFMRAGAAPGGVSLNRERLATAGARAWDSVPTLGAANQGVFFWMPGTFRFWNDNAYDSITLALAGVVLIGLPLVFAATGRRPFSSWFHDLRVVAAGMLIVLPLFLWVCGLVGTYVYVRDFRYYEPVRPLAVCIAFFIATLDTAGVGRRFAAVARSSGVYVLAFILMTAVEIAAAVTVPGAPGAIWRRAILGADPRPWPSLGLTYESSHARRFVLDLLKAEPTALLLTTREQWFYAEPEADRSRVMRWEPCASLRATHIEGPVRFLIFEEDRGGSPAHVQWPDEPAARRACWPEVPGVRLIRRFPDERLRVLQADIPEGVRLPIRRLPEE